MGDRRIAWFTIGVSVALLLSVLDAPARAQGAERPAGGNVGGSDATLPSITRPSGTATGGQGTRNSSSQDLDDAYAAPGIPPPVPQDDITGDQPENLDGVDPVTRAGQRPVLQDGNLTTEQGPLPVQDGIVNVNEPLPAEDGTDPSTIDTRPPEDIAVFENPPAGFDPLLFQIEDLDPIRDNRAITRLFRQEPYDPIGIRVGSFIMFPELVMGGTWTSNVFKSPSAASDIAFNFQPSARLVSNWTRQALEFRASGGLSTFSDNYTENDKSYNLETRGRIDIAKRTNVEVLLSRDHSLESRSALDASAVGSRASVNIDRAEASLNHRFNRLSLQFRGSVSDYGYGTTENQGVVSSNTDRDYQQTEETARASWEFKPTLSAFTEVDVNQRNYDKAAATDLINRSSDGQRYKVGVSFGNTGQILRGEVSAGYGVQSPNDNRLKSIDGFIFDANATWRASELTSVLITARSDVSETTTANEGGAFARTAGLEVRHQLRKYLIASAGLTYTVQDTQDGSINDKELRSTLGLEYYASPEAVVFSRYTHTGFNGVGTTSDYSADELYMGVRLRR
jgi:hypothetical protein